MSQVSRVLLLRTASMPSGNSGLSIKTFVPNLQIAADDDNDGDYKQSRNSPKADSMNSIDERARIMIVDDEKDITAIFKTGLERAGFNAEVFNDPLQALSQFKPNYYDLLLLDVRMPQMSGFELFHEISKKDKDVKACFVSAYEIYNKEIMKYLPNKGEDCIIRKPVSTRDLIRIIREELGEIESRGRE